MHYLFEALLVAFSLWMLWRVVRAMKWFTRKPEPPDKIGVPARIRRGPRKGAGSVALNEPDE